MIGLELAVKIFCSTCFFFLFFTFGSSLLVRSWFQKNDSDNKFKTIVIRDKNFLVVCSWLASPRIQGFR